MFLKEIRLKNFKCITDLSLSFEKGNADIRKWTIILGENGTGKSNLLKAIALITSGSNALGELLGSTDSWIRNNEPFCTIEAVLQTKKGEERPITLQFNRGDHLSNIISNNKESLQLIDEALEYTERTYFVVAYGASRRLSGDAMGSFEKSRSHRFGSVRNLFDGNASLNPLTAWVIDLDYRMGNEGLSVVATALNDFLPGITFSHIDKERKQLFFHTVDGAVPLEQLSDGYQNMAAWIGDLLYRITETFKDYKEPMKARGLLLIDEVDLHLHPKWQRRLIDFIGQKLPNFQVIATTHSPLTAQQADAGELYALRRNNNGFIELLPFVGAPRQLLVNQLLMSPVFGLETDESLEVQKAKEIYNKHKAGTGKTNAVSKKELESAKKVLDEKLPTRNLALASKKEIALLEKLEKKLNISE